MKRLPHKNRETRRAATKAKDRAFGLKAIAVAVACVVGFFVFEHFYWTARSAASLEKCLASWKTRYQLTEEQVQHVRMLEQAFHGSGNPLNPVRHTFEEERAHSEALRTAMKVPGASTGEPLP